MPWSLNYWSTVLPYLLSWVTNTFTSFACPTLDTRAWLLTHFFNMSTCGFRKIIRVRLNWIYCCWNWKLKTENWKLYSKIIFKCVNSTVWPIFNFFLYVNSAVNSNEQCMNSNFCPLHNEPMWGYCSRTGKKKKCKTWNVNVGFSWNQTGTRSINWVLNHV